MKKLSPGWFAEDWIDFEYKKFTLLAYLQDVRRDFHRTMLYPGFGDLIYHYRNLVEFRDNKNRIKDQFPSEIKKLDFEKLKLELEPVISDESTLREVEGIIEYAIPQFRDCLEEGKTIYDFIDDKLAIDAVGVVPLYTNEGYLFIYSGNSPAVKAFEYQVSVFDNSGSRYRGIHTSFLRTFQRSLSLSFEQMKLALLLTEKKLPNPATFLLTSALEFPENETLIPVAKRKFIQFLSEFDQPPSA